MNHEHHAHDHSNHGHAGHGGDHAVGHSMGSDAAQSFLRRFWIVTVLLVPLVLANETVAGFIGLGERSIHPYIQFALATIIFGFALVFFEHARHEWMSGRIGMMTLVSIAVGSGYAFSAVATFIPQLHTEFYLEISTLVWVLLFGHYLEARSSVAAGDALSEVAKLLPKEAHKRTGRGETEDVPISDLADGDEVIVKSGEKVPADGEIVEGVASIDQSHITGESKPVRKGAGDEVAAGSIATDGSLTIRITRTGEHSTVGQIKALIAEAQASKPRSQKLADTAAGVLTAIAVLTALATLVVWTFILGESFVFGITLAITVLVITCPHALGLAIPTVTTITTSVASKNGIFIKNLAKIETIRSADYVVFDKTGTLTEGTFGVSGVYPLRDSETREDILTIAGALDRNSSHPIAAAIVRAAREETLSFPDVKGYKNIAGKGSVGRIDKKTYLAGNHALMEEYGVASKDAGSTYENISEGKTAVFVADEERILGYIALSDKIRPEALDAVNALHERNIKVAMLTGDSEPVAQSVAAELGIDTVFANVSPNEKYSYIKKLQDEGNSVLMVGDGVNDAPALAQAHAGIAIGAGTDVAVEAGDVVLTRNNPMDVARLVILARKVYWKMVQNLIWALGYNIVAIPAAAGAFAAWGIFLRPEIGALVMSVSTVVVVANALLLKRINLQEL